MTEKPIPNYVDDQLQIFFWELDEFFPTLAIFLLFFMWDYIVLGILFAWAFSQAFSRFKLSSMNGVLFHLAWWFGVMKMNDRFDNGLTREACQ